MANQSRTAGSHATRPLDIDNATERDARAQIEACVCRPLSDEDWKRKRDKLLEFARILRAWHRSETELPPDLVA